jgi:hypothetical protein
MSTNAGFVQGMDVDLAHAKLYWAAYIPYLARVYRGLQASACPESG